MEQQDENTRVVKLTGEMTVRTIAEAWQNLREALQDSDKITVDVSEISAVDMSFIQLLLSARRSAAQQHKEFRLATPVEGDIRDTLSRGGFLEPPAGGRAFWLQETEDTHG